MKSFILLLFFIFGACAPVLATPVGASFPRDEFLEIHKGHRNGHLMVHKFGHNTDVDTAGVPEDIWGGGGVYTGFPSENEKVEVISSSVADTAGGTGCQEVHIFGLDTNKDLQDEQIATSGTSGTQSVSIYSRVNRVICSLSGSGQKNAGAITIRHVTTTANIFAVVAIGVSQSHIGCYTVPRGYTGYLMNYRFSMFDSTTNNASVAFSNINGNNTKYLVRPEAVSTTHSPQINIVGGLQFIEMTDGCGRVTSIDNNNGSINFSFEMVLVKNGN